NLAHDIPKYAPIVRRSTGRPLELSFGQQRLWFLSQLDSGSIAYNVPMGWRLTGPLDVNALRWSLNEILRAHETFRPGFPIVSGQPVQHITAQQSVSLTIVDLRPTPEAERDAELQRQIKQDTRRPFDLACDPMLRAALFQLSDNEYLFVVTVHHIAC